MEGWLGSSPPCPHGHTLHVDQMIPFSLQYLQEHDCLGWGLPGVSRPPLGWVYLSGGQSCTWVQCPSESTEGEWVAEGRLPSCDTATDGSPPWGSAASPPSLPTILPSLFYWFLCSFVGFSVTDSDLKRDYFLPHSFLQNAQKTITEMTIYVKQFNQKLFMSFLDSYDCVYYVMSHPDLVN